MLMEQLKEFFKAKNLLGNSIIPLLAFLILGFAQRNFYDWTQLKNRGYERGIEIAGFLFVYFVLYALTVPFVWLRPPMKVKLYLERSSRSQPLTSQVFDLAKRNEFADVTIEVQFTPSWITRKWLEKAGMANYGIKLAWSPKNLFSCSSQLKGDGEFCKVNDNGIDLFPFGKMNLEDPNLLQYSFRFALGTTEVVQQTRLRPKHLNLKSRLLFRLSSETQFLFEIQNTRRGQVSGETSSLLSPPPEK